MELSKLHFRNIAALIVGCWFVPTICFGQQAPSIGYVYPAGGQAGTTVDAKLGGFDWTPDIQIFCLNTHVKLEVLGPPGEVIVPEPPYWFGKKGRSNALPMPRETPVRFVLPADLPVGPIYWQAANANGATTRGIFRVSHTPEVIEEPRESSDKVQQLPSLPVIVNGQIKKIEEVDRYILQAPHTGPVTCRVAAKSLNSQLRTILEVRDQAGQLIADVADTEHKDASLTFAAVGGQSYSLSLYDLDFRGDRSLTYRLEIVPQPDVLATIPAYGRRGETRSVEFVGIGLATGAAQIERVKKEVTFPSDPHLTSFVVSLDLPTGPIPVTLGLSAIEESVEPASLDLSQRRLVASTAVTGILEEKYGDDRYLFAGKMAQPVWIQASTAFSRTSLDLSLTILDAKGQMVATIDDLPNSLDAGFLFTPSADGDYQITVADMSGMTGTPASTYRLSIEPPQPDFSLKVPENLSVPINGKTPLSLTVIRHQGFTEAINVKIEGLPPGITAPDNLIVAKGANDLKIELTSGADVASTAHLITVSGSSQIGDKLSTRSAGQVLIASTMKPPFTIDAGGKDDVTKWPRGTTFPAPVLIERDATFNGEIRLEMAAFNDRHRQGIRGPEMIVPAGAKQVIYPVHLPEYLETTRTSRIVLNGVAKIKDPKGQERHLVSRLLTRIGFLPGGALLKVAHRAEEMSSDGKSPFEIPVVLSRSIQLTGPVKLELVMDDNLKGQLLAESRELPPEVTVTTLKVTPAENARLAGRKELLIRATTLKDGTLPVYSETKFTIEFPAAQGVKPN